MPHSFPHCDPSAGLESKTTQTPEMVKMYKQRKQGLYLLFSNFAQALVSQWAA